LRTAGLRNTSSNSRLGNYYCSDYTAQGDSDPSLLLLYTRGKRVTEHIGGYHRITESQNSRGWKGPLWVI